MPRRRRQIRNRTDARKRILCITLALLPLVAAIAALVALLVTRKDSASLGIDNAAVLEAQIPSLPLALNGDETQPPISLVSKTTDAPSPSPYVSDASPPPSIPAAASQFLSPSINDIIAIASSSSSNLPTSASTSNAPSNSVPPVSSVPSSRQPSGRAPEKPATPSTNNNSEAPWEQEKLTGGLRSTSRPSASSAFPSGQPSMALSPAPSASPTALPSWRPTVDPSASPSMRSLVDLSPVPPTWSTAPSSLRPTIYPSAYPTRRPSVASTSDSPINFLTSSKGDFPYAFPAFRYKEWSKLDKVIQEIAANTLGYTPTSWNVVGGGFATIEQKGWAGLDFNERVGAIRLGYDKNTWECFVHHYQSYTWGQLGAANIAAQEGAHALGWTEALWDGGDTPGSDDKWWGELTEAEELAANGLCYFEDNWNQVDMNPNRSFFPHPPPEFRYVPWRELSTVARGMAKDGMGYVRDTWNVLDTNPLELFRTFHDLNISQREAANTLGFYPHSWNCFINHFDAISWRGFYGDTKLALETLGWTVESWDRSAPAPASEGKDWDELSSRERAAATLICYFRETWDNIAITEWYDYEKGMNTAISADQMMPSDIDMSILRNGNLV